MIDVFNTPDSSNNVKVFYSTGTNAWQIWNKPKNCRFVNMFLIGGGGGGTGGSAGGAATVGGAGGGSSSITSGIFLASVLPDVLYIQVGIGGQSGIGEIDGASGTNGGNGTLSYVSVFPSATTSSLISNTNPIVLASGNAAAGGAIYGSTDSIPGTAGTIFSQSSPLFNIFSYLGIITTIAGQAGGDGTYANLNPPTNLNIISLTSGGAGGAGTNSTTLYNGASVVGVAPIPTISGGTTTIIDGNHGFTNLNQTLNGNRQPLFFTGGAGGASVSSGTAGRGGNGSYGCGGGGGGGNTNSSVINIGGSGGRGGDGIVIITAW
jgi:hypothetical protein